MGSELLIQLQMGDRSQETLINGNFENWTGPNLDNWNITAVGASTVTQEATILRPNTTGSSAVRFTYDATPGAARITQTNTFLKEAWYILKFWYKYKSYVNGEEFKIRFRDSGSNVYLDSDSKWQVAPTNITIPISDSWTYFELKFLTHPDYSSYVIDIGRGSTVTSAYVIVDDAEIKLDTIFRSWDTIDWNGAQWTKGILNNINIVDNAAYKGNYEESGLTVGLFDEDGFFRSILDNPETQAVIGNEAIVRYEDGTRVSDYKITDINYTIDEVFFRLGTNYAELTDNKVPPQITEEEFPTVSGIETSIGKYINYFSGQFQIDPTFPIHKGTKNYLVAHRIRDRIVSTTDGRYLIGKSIQNIISWGGGQDFQFAIDSNDADQTTNCALVLPTATDPYHYVDLASNIPDVDFIKVHFKYPAISAETLIEEIGDLLFTSFEFDISDIVGLLGWGGRHYNLSSPGNQDHTDPHFVIDNAITRIVILKNICETFNLSYRINGDRKIIFKIFDFNAIYDSGETTELQPGISSAFIPGTDREEYKELINQFNTTFGYTDGENRKNTVLNNFESQEKWNNIRDKSISASLLPGNFFFPRLMLFNTVKLWMLEHFNTQKATTFRVLPMSQQVTDTQKLRDVIKPLQILKFKHDNFKDDNFHYMQIRRVNTQYPGDGSSDVDFIDISHIEEIDTNCSFLLQSDDDNGSLIFFDRAADGYHFIRNFDDTVKHDNTYLLFGKSSITNIGSTPELRFGLVGYYFDLHIMAALSANDFKSSMLSIWVRFNNSGNQEGIVSQHVDTNNFWWLFKQADDTVRIRVLNGGTVRMNMASTSTVADGKWHHIVFYRTDSIAGLYIDGQQENNDTRTVNYTYDTNYTVMNDGNSMDYMDGNIQDLYITLNPDNLPAREKGWFDLNPNAGNTDTYVVPYGLMSNFWQRYWNDF